MTTYEITYQDADLLNREVVTRVSCHRFTLEGNWFFFRENDEEQTTKLVVQAGYVLSIQDLDT